jgi:hypothetical protein
MQTKTKKQRRIKYKQSIREYKKIPVEARFSTSTKTGPGAHPDSYTMRTRSFFLGPKRPVYGVNHPPPYTQIFRDETLSPVSSFPTFRKNVTKSSVIRRNRIRRNTAVETLTSRTFTCACSHIHVWNKQRTFTVKGWLSGDAEEEGLMTGGWWWRRLALDEKVFFERQDTFSAEGSHSLGPQFN